MINKDKRSRGRKGFTLVELLAVIVILAIILVIAVPQIMNTIKDTTKASFESSAKMVASQVENQYTVAQTLGKEFGDTGSCMEEWAGLNNTDYESCTYKMDEGGTAKVTLAGSGKFNGLYVCDGTRSSATTVEGGCGPKYTKLSSIATTSTNLGVTSVHTCATSGTCEDGTAFAIKVNNTETYKFYVINDTGKEITLIMNQSFNDERYSYSAIPWISVNFYVDNCGKNNKGPLTALRILKEKTSGWTNIEPYSYTLENDSPNSGDYGYASFEVEDVRARLPKYSDFIKFMPEHICSSHEWPDYLKENNRNDLYWLSTASREDPAASYAFSYDDVDGAFCLGKSWNSRVSTWGSVRPVITLSR